MIKIGSAEQPPQPRRRHNSPGISPVGAGSYVTGFMGREGRDGAKPSEKIEKPSPDVIFPMAYLVEQDAHSSLKAHFHVADQFQLFVAGGGQVGAKTVETTSIHFAGVKSPYGPVQAGSEGVSYLTLRNGYDNGARFMPESRNELPARPTGMRDIVGKRVETSPPADLARTTEMLRTEMIALQPDGLGAWHYRLAPGQAFVGPDPATGRGQHWVVTAGELEIGGKAGSLKPFSCIFLSADEPAFTGKAGAAGLEIVVSQYPNRTEW